MWGQLLRLVGRRAVHKAVGHQAQRQGIDIKLGFALFRDKRVPLGAKVLAVSLGITGMILLDLLELPAETFIAVMLPVLGFMLDGIFAGVENVVGPILLSAICLNFTAPKSVVAQLRRERSGVTQGVIDVESYPVNPTVQAAV